MTAKTPEEFRERAANSERLAETAILLEEREVLLRIASRWRAMAEETEKRLKSGKPTTEPAVPA
jgi:hypothetical protein